MNKVDDNDNIYQTSLTSIPSEFVSPITGEKEVVGFETGLIIKHLEDEVAYLSCLLTIKEAENRSLIEELSQTTELVRASLINETIETIKNYENAIQAKVLEIQNLKMDLQAMQDEKHQQELDVSQYNNELRKRDNDYHHLKISYDSIKIKLEEKEKENALLREENEKNKSSLIIKSKSNESDIEILRSQINDSYLALKQTVSEKNSELDFLQKELTVTKEQVKKFQDLKNEFEVNNSELVSLNNQLKEENRRLLDEIHSLKKQHDEELTLKDLAISKPNDLENTTRILQEEVINLTKCLKKDYFDLSANNQREQQMIEQLTKERNSLQLKVEEYEQQLLNFKEINKRGESKILEIQERYNETVIVLEKDRKDKKELERMLLVQTQETESLKQKLVQNTTLLVKLENNEKELRMKMVDLVSQFKESEISRSTLTQKLYLLSKSQKNQTIAHIKDLEIQLEIERKKSMRLRDEIEQMKEEQTPINEKSIFLSEGNENFVGLENRKSIHRNMYQSNGS